jgi:hypothetical protein
MEVLVEKDSSFLNFVYPISFNPVTFRDQLNIFDNQKWQGRKGLFKVWAKQSFPEEDLLPHVSKFLNPPETVTPTARIWKLSNEALLSVAGGLGGGGQENIQWFLLTRFSETRFRISSINLVLFNSGVGFITFCVEPLSNKSNDWLDFLHFFRFIDGRRNVSIRISRKTGCNSITKETTFSPFFPVPAGGLENHPDGKGTISEIIRGLLKPAGNLNNGELWWSEIFTSGKMLPFVSIFMDNVTSHAAPNILYKIRNFFHSEENIYPSGYDLSCENDLLLPYGKEQWFFFSLDGGGFVAINPPENNFVRCVLPDHLAKHYFLLYILTLQQRFTLIKLLDSVATHWYETSDVSKKKRENERRISFEIIRDHLLSFTARGFYAHAMQGEHHHRCYKKWQIVFQVERLYNEVKAEVWSMNEYINMQHEQQLQKYEEEKRLRSERLEKQIGFLAWLFGVPALSLTYLGAIGGGDWKEGLIYLGGGLIVGVLFYFLARFIASNMRT